MILFRLALALLVFSVIYDSGVWQPAGVNGHGYRRRSWHSYGFGLFGFGLVDRSAACTRRGGVCVEKSSCLQFTPFLCNGTFACCPLDDREYEVYYIRKVIYPHRRQYWHRRSYSRHHYR